MNDYYALRADITPCTEDMTDYYAALLAEIGYESFVPDEYGLVAYIKAEDYNPANLEGLMEEWPFESTISTKSTFIEGQDWNAEWEKNYFKPIVIEDKCVIHSSFHKDIPECQYDIIIDPKMAFGTGHHATTSLIINNLLNLNLENKTVIDMGTGTGILAILAAMRGSTDVYGVEIDPFAYENAIVNTSINGHPEITVINGDRTALDSLPVCDVFIANINRNIITQDLPYYVEKLKPKGIMLLSGFYESDVDIVMQIATPLGLKEKTHTVKGDNWTCLYLEKI